MKTIISLKGLHFHANHGFYKEEQIMGNPFILHVSIEIDGFNSSDDDINDTINYENVYQVCKEEMANTQKLLESVTLNISTRLKKQFPHIIKGEVTLEKIGPQLGGKVDKAVVSMEF